MNKSSLLLKTKLLPDNIYKIKQLGSIIKELVKVIAVIKRISSKSQCRFEKNPIVFEHMENKCCKNAFLDGAVYGAYYFSKEISSIIKNNRRQHARKKYALIHHKTIDATQ